MENKRLWLGYTSCSIFCLYSPIDLFVTFVILFPIFAWIFGSLRFGSADIDRFRTFIDLPGDFRDAMFPNGEVALVVIVGTVAAIGLWDEGALWETFRSCVARPRDGDLGALLVTAEREREGEARGERAVDRVVIDVAGARETWVPGGAKVCWPLIK